MANLPKSLSKNGLFQTDDEAKKVLKEEGRKLKYCALRVWRQYLSSYKPKQYIRTKDSVNSIRLGNVYKTADGEWNIEVTFVNDLAYHDSVIGRNQPQGHAIMLISYGWNVKGGVHKDIPRFGKYGGFDYLGKVFKMYDGIRDKRVSLDAQWLGRDNFTR